MILPLTQAPQGAPLQLENIGDAQLAQKLDKLGVCPKSTVTLLQDEAIASPVRVRTDAGEVILASGMAAKIIVHHDDGHKTPIMEMKPGEKGHVEGLVCGPGLEKGLVILGLRKDAAVDMIRRIPPMDYLTSINNAHVIIPEGAAAKIWGRMRGVQMQFAMVGKGKDFVVEQLLGGARASAMLHNLGAAPGTTLQLKNVVPANKTGRAAADQFVLAAKSGLRLYLRPDQAATVIVRTEDL